MSTRFGLTGTILGAPVRSPDDERKVYGMQSLLSSGAYPPRLWVITECYPRPAAMRHCAFVHRQMSEVMQAGWDVRVLVPNGWFPSIVWRAAPAWRAARAHSIPKGWTLNGISVSDLTYQNRVPSRFCHPSDALSRIAVALTRHLKKLGANPRRDLLLVQFALPYGPVAREVSKALALPYVVQLRGDDVWRYPHMHGAKRMNAFVESVRDADLVLAVAQSLIEEAKLLTSGELPPTAVVANGIDLHRFRPAKSAAQRENLRKAVGIRPGELVVLCVGDALIRKGWIELLDAFGGLPVSLGSVVLLAVCSSSKDQVDISAEAARRAPNIRLHLMQDVPTERLADVYRASDVFCLLSHWEGLANALLEAMASGLPVVTSAVAGHPEVITDGVDGFVVPAKEIEPVRSALITLLKSPRLRQKVGMAARERAEAVGDSRKAGRRLAAILDGLLKKQINSNLLAQNPYSPKSGTVILC